MSRMERRGQISLSINHCFFGSLLLLFRSCCVGSAIVRLVAWYKTWRLTQLGANTILCRAERERAVLMCRGSTNDRLLPFCLLEHHFTQSPSVLQLLYYQLGTRGYYIFRTPTAKRKRDGSTWLCSKLFPS